MKTNREQALFLLVLVIAGLLIYLRHSGAYQSPPLPRERAFPLVEAPRVPEVRFPDTDEPRTQRGGRDVFMPPRDWNPLPPLILDPPPLPPIGAVGLLPEPSVESAHLRFFRLAPPPAAPAAAGAEPEQPAPAGEEDDASAEEGAAEDERFGGIDFPPAAGAEAAAPAPAEAALEKSYDWFKRKGRPRVYGYVLNPDKFALLDNPSLALQFKAVNVVTGKDSGTATFQRADLEGDGAFGQGFGFADTVRNRVVLERRLVKPSAGSVRSQLEAARKCLGWASEDAGAALEGAEQFLRSALSFNPLEADAWELLGRVQELAGDTEAEIGVCDEARAAGVADSRLETRRARILRRLGLAQAAESILRAGLRLNPNDQAAWAELGRVLLAAERGAEAVAALESALKVSGLSAEARQQLRVELVRALIRVNRAQEALSEVDRVLRLGGEQSEARVLKGVLDLMSGDTANAIGEFRTALEENPRHRAAVYDLGVALARGAGEPAALEQARARFQEAADLDPLAAFDSAVALGALEESAGNLEKAAFWFEEALLFEPGEPFGLYRAGRIARLSGDLESAEARLRESLERDGRITDVLNELGYTALLQDEPETAERYLRESLRREPDNREVRVLLGAALLRMNQVAAAREEFKMGAGDPQLPAAAALCGVAWCEYREGNVDQALQQFAAARAACPAESDPHRLYADRNQALVDDHRGKEQWVDRFNRKQIKNDWTLTEPHGPQIRLNGDGQLEISGVQRQESAGERSELSRVIAGAAFVLLEARFGVAASCEGKAGLRFAYERPGKDSGPQIMGEIAVARCADGSLRVLARSREEAEADWLEVPDVRLPAGQEFQLGIERTDAERGVFRILVDERVVLDGIEVSGLKKLRREVVGALFVEADARQNVAVTSGFVRVVRYQG
ncbi:MAG: tetratricopeptide repeat protein [Planctomycetes bacterium]|nr:tetratricopeptide repeat protein [Planctomycetota bacterium]